MFVRNASINKAKVKDNIFYVVDIYDESSPANKTVAENKNLCL